MQKKFVLKSVKALKKVAALGAGLTMLGATLTGALAVDLGDYPAPFVDANGVYNDANVFVAGANAAASDTLGMVDISTNLQYMAKKPVSSGGNTVSVIGGESKEIPIGFEIANSSITNYFDSDNQDDEVSSLFDGTITFKGTEYDAEEILTFKNTGGSGTNQLGPKILTGIDDEDYGTDVYMEVPAKDRITYRYKFTESINLSQVSNNDNLQIDFLGKPIKITSIGTSGDRITAYVGEEFHLVEGDSVEVAGKTVKLNAVGSSNIVVEVDGEASSISSTAGSSQLINGIEITVDFAISKTNIGESSAGLVLGEESSSTYKNADPYVGEDSDDPDWVWAISGLQAADTAVESAVLSVENDFTWNKLGDNPPGVGECIDMPNDYLSICLDSLSVSDDDYMDIHMEIVEEDLSDAIGTSFNSEKVLRIESVGQTEGLYLQQAPGVDNYSSVTDKYVDVIYLRSNGSTRTWDATNLTGDVAALDVFFEDNDDSNKIKYWGAYDGSDFIAEVNYKDTKSNDVRLYYNSELVGGGLATANISLMWDIQGKQTADCPDGTDDLDMQWQLASYVLDSLGNTADTAEASELQWGPSNTAIGTKDTDLRTHYGIIIKDPDSNGASDQVQLRIPSDQVFANVVLKGTDSTTTSGGVSYVPTEVNPKTMLDSEVSDPTAYNLILVGGPCANTLVETVFGMACEDWSYAEGEGIVKMVENGENVAMLVAGTTAIDTRRACKAVGNYGDHALTGSEVLVKGTTVDDVTVETPSAE